MMDDDQADRMSSFFAAQEIELHLGLSRGAAQAKMRELRANGTVRWWPRGTFVDVSKSDLANYFSKIGDHQVSKGQEDSKRDAEIRKLLTNDHLRPGKDIQWKPFYNLVRKACNARPTDHGFSNETIKRRTKQLQKQMGQIG